MRHWAIQLDRDTGEPLLGRPCDCPIGVDHEQAPPPDTPPESPPVTDT